MSEKKLKSLTAEDVDNIINQVRSEQDVEIGLTGPEFAPSIGGQEPDPRYPESGATVAEMRELERRYGTSGVDIDPRGLPAGYRALSGLAQTGQDKRAIYNKVFGEENVRPIEGTDKFLIRVYRDGKPVDVVDDESAFSMRDLADLTGMVPELATSIATTVKMLPKNPAGLAATAGTAAAASAAGQAVGGAKDLGLRYLIGEDLDAGEIVKRRLPAAAIETGFGTALPYASQKVFSKLRPSSVSSGAEPVDRAIAKEGSEAAKKLEAEGIPAPLTAGEATGSRGIQEYEALAEKLARITDPTGEIRLAQQEAIKKGQSSLPEMKGDIDRKIGDKISARLKAQEMDLSDAAAQSAQEAVRRAEANVGLDLSQSVVDAGNKVRSGLQKGVQAKQAEVDELYETANRMRIEAGGDEAFIIPSETSKLGKEVVEKETLIKETTESLEVPTGVLSESGEQITEEVLKTSKQPIGWAVPAYKEAQSFAQLGDTPQTIEAMREARAVFGEAIGRAQSAGLDSLGGGFSLGQAKRFYKALSQDIDDSLKALDPDAAAAFQKAQSESKSLFDTYTSSKTMNGFRLSEAEGGLAEVSDIVRHFSQNKGKPGMLLSMKKILSPEDYSVLKKGILADLGDGATYRFVDGSSGVDFRILQKRLSKMQSEMRHELVGGKDAYNRLDQALNDFKTAQDIAEGSPLQFPAQVSAEELDNLLAKAGDPNMFQSVKESIEASIMLKRRQLAEYGNEVTAAVRQNDQLSGKINADDFIDGFILKQTDAKLVRQALDKLTEEQEQEVAKQLVRRIFDKSRDLAKQPLDALKKGDEGVITGRQLKEILFGGQGQRRIIQEVLPKETLEKMENLLAYQMAIENARSQAGGFARDYAIGNMSKETIGKITMARLVFSDAMQSFLKKAAASPSALSKFSALAGKGMDRLPSKIGPTRVIVSSYLGKEVADLAMQWGEATRGLDEEEIAALRQSYLSIPQQREVSEEELKSEMDRIFGGNNKQGKTAAEKRRDARIKARMPSKSR